jgi:hypothetical protein
LNRSRYWPPGAGTDGEPAQGPRACRTPRLPGRGVFGSSAPTAGPGSGIDVLVELEPGRKPEDGDEGEEEVTERQAGKSVMSTPMEISLRIRLRDLSTTVEVIGIQPQCRGAAAGPDGLGGLSLRGSRCSVIAQNGLGSVPPRHGAPHPVIAKPRSGCGNLPVRGLGGDQGEDRHDTGVSRDDRRRGCVEGFLLRHCARSGSWQVPSDGSWVKARAVETSLGKRREISPFATLSRNDRGVLGPSVMSTPMETSLRKRREISPFATLSRNDRGVLGPSVMSTPMETSLSLRLRQKTATALRASQRRRGLHPIAQKTATALRASQRQGGRHPIAQKTATALRASQRRAGSRLRAVS